MDFETFSKWVYKNHTLSLQYAHRSIVIATSLVSLDDIEYIDQQQNMQQIPQGASSYPSFK
jgi:hypothetical protein